MRKHTPEKAAEAKARHRAIVAAHRPRQVDENAQLVERLREEMGNACAICGSSQGLEFAHIDASTKLFNVGGLERRSESAIRAEAAKCRLLCQAHHREETRVARRGRKRPVSVEVPTGVLKTCCDCREAKDTSNFHRASARKDGRQTACKTCFMKRNEVQREETRKYINSRKDRCVVCGETNKDMLEFDHVESKRWNISYMLTHSRKSLDEEIAKCEVVCRNHHKERTAKRKGP